MDTAKLNDWMQVIGIFALVASLVFVGLQMKQSQEIAIASQYHDRAALSVEAYNQQIEGGVLTAWGSFLDENLYPSLSVEDRGRMYLWGTIYLTQVDNHYFQYQSGFMQEEAWQAQLATLKRVMRASNSPGPAAYRNSATQYRASFVALVDQIIQETGDQP